MTAEQLKKAEAAYRAASSRAETARAARNAAVAQALADGWTHAQIAEATGLTRSRVGQIVPRDTPKPSADAAEVKAPPVRPKPAAPPKPTHTISRGTASSAAKANVKPIPKGKR
jgi:hypothetical protein